MTRSSRSAPLAITSSPGTTEPGGLEGAGGASRAPARVVERADALAWLAERGRLAGASLITSLPDVSGLPGASLDQWRAWFMRAARLCMAACPDEGVAIFYQTDIKVRGTWVDKGYLCQRAAEDEGMALLWHRIVCRRPPGRAAFGRPGYSHLLCFARAQRDDGRRAYADVLPSTGHMTWTQAMGVDACRLACEYVLSSTTTRTVVDPFCGYGTVLAVANALGLAAVGVELNKKRARKARQLELAGVLAPSAEARAAGEDLGEASV